MTSFYLEGEPHVHPRLLVEHYCSSRGLEKSELGIRPVVVGTFNAQLTRYLAEVSGASKLDRFSEWQGDAYIIGDALTLVTFRIGAPITVASMEEMHVLGMRTLITTGAAGSLQPDAPIGTIVVPTSAIREEGTSHHYAPVDVPALPDPALADELAAEAEAHSIAVRRGPNWTTDAVYMEHKQKIARYRDAGVVTVDMELSAIFTVAAVRGITAAAVIAVSDELHGDEWRIGFGGQDTMRGMMKASRVALTVAARRAGVTLP
jgi:uridine phosphorylase